MKAKMTTAEIMEYASVSNGANAIDILLLCGPDNFTGDFDKVMAKLKEQRDAEWKQAGAVQFEENGRKWWAMTYMNGDVNLYNDDGNFICRFDSLDELMFFVKGVK